MSPGSGGARRIEADSIRRSSAPIELTASSGPDQSKGKCLLERPGQLHLNPNASTSSSVAVPQVATWPDRPRRRGRCGPRRRVPSRLVGPTSASAPPLAFPGTSTRQLARSSAISISIGAYSMPRISSIRAANPAGQPPACPPKIAWIASRCGSSARSSMKKPIAGFASPSQIFPTNEPTATTFSPSSPTSP